VGSPSQIGLSFAVGARLLPITSVLFLFSAMSVPFLFSAVSVLFSAVSGLLPVKSNPDKVVHDCFIRDVANFVGLILLSSFFCV